MLYGTGYYVTIYVLREEKAGDKFTESHLLVRCIGKIHPAAGEFITCQESNACLRRLICSSPHRTLIGII
jgi:hypothetical protein